ncbi:MAG TPA: 50S ribosomal protein L11 [Candidatus Pacearchaeota archaeon]|nr:50S ribosomal protein L11 [Candidatus Pacearchaeota archaeon]HOU45876.1 50S ribosomal protein L11 [Candidatus Pacearchaeota archaeon]HPM08335.1 50S ribosomal protein L11 [Candidatus Pacearchaeota archaeon]HQI74333.1 50S ribosomal protein L11 [Candidatus Pacearchaeota archaeon]
MAKKVKALVKIQIMAGQATPAPPIGPSLAQHGINIAEFCKKFNDATRDKMGFRIPAVITVYEDRSYDFILRQPVASALIKKAAGIEKGSGKPNKSKAGKITKAKLREIAQQKMADLNANDVEHAMNILAGTAKNMGIDVID